MLEFKWTSALVSLLYGSNNNLLISSCSSGSGEQNETKISEIWLTEWVLVTLISKSGRNFRPFYPTSGEPWLPQLLLMVPSQIDITSNSSSNGINRSSRPEISKKLDFWLGRAWFRYYTQMHQELLRQSELGYLGLILLIRPSGARCMQKISCRTVNDWSDGRCSFKLQ